MKQTELEIGSDRTSSVSGEVATSCQTLFRQSQADLSTGVEILYDILKVRGNKNILLAWRVNLREHGLDAARVEWVIKTLQTDIEFRKAASLNEDIFTTPPIVASAEDNWLLVRLKHIPNNPTHQLADEQVLIRLDESILFEKGKSTKMQCSKCECVLHILLQQPIDVNATAERLSINAEKVSIESSDRRYLIEIGAKSINHAYTLASMLLETERISHSGNVFQNILFLDKKRILTPLSAARSMAENWEWDAERDLTSLTKYTNAEVTAVYAKAPRVK